MYNNIIVDHYLDSKTLQGTFEYQNKCKVCSKPLQFNHKQMPKTKAADLGIKNVTVLNFGTDHKSRVYAIINPPPSKRNIEYTGYADYLWKNNLIIFNSLIRLFFSLHSL